MPNHEHDPGRPQRIAGLANELSEFFGERQRFHAERARDFAYAKEVFRLVAQNVRSAPDDPLLAESERSLEKFRLFAESREAAASRNYFDVSSMSFAIGTSTTSTISAIGEVASWINEYTSPAPPPHWSAERRITFAERLGRLDSELGKLARTVWQSFYGATENAERTSLFSMRQLYDHLFAVLAPDEKVRASRFFTPKVGDKAHQIHRRERLSYAAETHIDDEGLRETLLAQVEHVTKLYDHLNELHARRPIDRRRAEELLVAMEEVLQEWLAAIHAR